VIAVLVLLTEDGESLSRTKYHGVYLASSSFTEVGSRTRESRRPRRIRKYSLSPARTLKTFKRSLALVEYVVALKSFNENIQEISSSRATALKIFRKVLLFTRIEEAIHSRGSRVLRSIASIIWITVRKIVQIIMRKWEIKYLADIAYQCAAGVVDLFPRSDEILAHMGVHS